MTMTSEQEELAAAMLTLAHVIRETFAPNDYQRQYAHEHVSEEYETWLGYVTGEGEPISPLGGNDGE